MNCLSLIRQRYSSMSPVEKRIAECILEEPEIVMNSTLVYVASKAKVSEGSIINFANSLGCKGFSQLKINLAQNVSNYSTQNELTCKDEPKQVFRKLIDRAVTSFESTFDTMENELEEAVELLLNANKILVVGVGSSVVLARDAQIRLMRIGLPAMVETDPLLASTMSAQTKTNDVVFAVSNSGRTKETIEVVKSAHDAGARVIGLTSHANSPLAKLCNVALIAVSVEAQNYQEAVTSRLTQLMLVDCLMQCLANRITNEAIMNQDKMAEIYEKHREALD